MKHFLYIWRGSVGVRFMRAIGDELQFEADMKRLYPDDLGIIIPISKNQFRLLIDIMGADRAVVTCTQ
jgi:hypothetical protein